MAKQKESAEESETNRSIGSKMKSGLSTHDRNLAVKNEMIEKGEREEPKQPSARTQRERNLAVKALQKKSKKDDNDETKEGKSKAEGKPKAK